MRNWSSCGGAFPDKEKKGLQTIVQAIDRQQGKPCKEPSLVATILSDAISRDEEDCHHAPRVKEKKEANNEWIRYIGGDSEQYKSRAGGE